VPYLARVALNLAKSDINTFFPKIITVLKDAELNAKLKSVRENSKNVLQKKVTGQNLF